jgi:hypothetical protein
LAAPIPSLAKIISQIDFRHVKKRLFSLYQDLKIELKPVSHSMLVHMAQFLWQSLYQLFESSKTDPLQFAKAPRMCESSGMTHDSLGMK